MPDVLGPLDTSAWAKVLTSKCGVSMTTINSRDGGIPTTDLVTSPLLVQLIFPAPSGDKRTDDISANDAFLATLIDLLPKQNYTVLYTTNRAADGTFVGQGKDAVEYDMDSQIQESMHMDLKRDLGVYAPGNGTGNNQTLIDGPLFDRYQFFTPGEYIEIVLRAWKVLVLTFRCRNLHGFCCWVPASVHTIRRGIRCGESPSHLRGV